MGIVIFLLVLSFLVFFHELGHFLVAKYFGVKVIKFSIGFGPMVYRKFYKGTLWAISIIPLGGYVQMKGQNDFNPQEQNYDKDSYGALLPTQKIAILFAGPLFNFILAFILYIIIALLPHKELAPIIGEIMPNSPAFKAQLQKDDTILKIDNKNVKTWNDIGDIIKNSDKKRLVFYIKRKNSVIKEILYPKILNSKNIFGEDIKKKMVGISPSGKLVILQYDFISSLKYAVKKTYDASKLIFQGIQKMISGVIGTEQIGGVISIGKVVSDASGVGIIAIFTIAALLSVNLGVLNLLPIPALDGGHIMFNLYELIVRRKPSEKVFATLTYTGWVVLIFLMGLGVYNDVNRFFLQG